MPGNTFGKVFTVTTYGESHGEDIGCIIDGFPPNFKISKTFIQNELNKRKPGSSAYTSLRKEQDKIFIKSGIYNNRTTGSPISLMIKNNNAISNDYKKLKTTYRPGHADYTYYKKYKNYDIYGGGRASARETAMRVAAGAFAKQYLMKKSKIKIFAYLKQIGNIKAENINIENISKNNFFFPEANKEKILMIKKLLHNIIDQGDSIGACISVIAKGVPPGLGEPVFDKLDADIAKAMMSINAVKGIEIGSGFSCINKYGSNNRDILGKNEKFLSNNSGGILGGISNGNDISANIAIKPTSSIKKPCFTLNKKGIIEEFSMTGRHDPCIGLRAVPVVESMMAIVLMDHYLRNKIQCK